jgi:hypothetical protein
MLQDILIFVAPFIVIIAAIVVAFWAAPKDGAVSKGK